MAKTTCTSPQWDTVVGPILKVVRMWVARSWLQPSSHNELLRSQSWTCPLKVSTALTGVASDIFDSVMLTRVANSASKKLGAPGSGSGAASHCKGVRDSSNRFATLLGQSARIRRISASGLDLSDLRLDIRLAPARATPYRSGRVLVRSKGLKMPNLPGQLTSSGEPRGVLRIAST